jgi:hypothetical protein
VVAVPQVTFVKVPRVTVVKVETTVVRPRLMEVKVEPVEDVEVCRWFPGKIALKVLARHLAALGDKCCCVVKTKCTCVCTIEDCPFCGGPPK